MTIVAQTIRTPDPPSEGVPDFHLIIYNETATIIERDFSALDETNAGLGIEITAQVDPSGASRTLVFTGRPDLVACQGNEIVQFRINDGDVWRDVFWGTVVEGWAALPMDDPKTYTADADELLNGTVTDAKAYGPQDPALIAADLVSRLRHPALKYDPTLFESTGTTLEGGFEQPGIPLGQALELLAQSVEDAGKSYAYGIDGRGYIFFREPTGVAEVLYRPEDVEGFEPLPVQARGTTTAVYWVVGNAPSDPNLVLTGDRVWGTEAYLSVPDAALHQKYGRVIGKAVDNPRSVYVSSRVDLVRASNFSVSNQIATKSAVPAAGVDATVELGFLNDPERTYAYLDAKGASFLYRCDYDVVDARVFINLGFASTEHEGGLVLPAEYAEFPLPYSHNKLTRLELVFPGVQPFEYDGLVYNLIYFATFTVRSRGAGLGLQVATPAVFKIDYNLLDAAARRELFTPAFEPATITPTRDTPDGLRTFYVQPKPQVRLRLYPGEPIAPAAGFRISFNEDFHTGTVIDLGTPNRDEEGQRLDQIRLGVERKTRLSEVRTIGRIGG